MLFHVLPAAALLGSAGVAGVYGSRRQWKKAAICLLCGVVASLLLYPLVNESKSENERITALEGKVKTLEAAGYVFVFTTLPTVTLGPGKALEFYRGRWQVELVFKRLKWILGLGHLRRSDEQAARSWIEGKLLVAFLIEVLVRPGESFFPWGYPLQSAQRA